MRLIIGLVLALLLRFVLADTGQSLYAPARYAFVADKGSPNIAVVDLAAGKQIDLIKLPTRVRTFAMSTDDGYFAFADRDKNRLYLYNTKTRQFSHIELPSYLYQMMFIPWEGKIAIRLAERVGIVDYRHNTLTLSDAEFPANGIDIKRETLFTMIFDVVNQTFWILNKQEPVIRYYSYLRPGWHEVKLGDFDGYATGVSAPDGEYIALNTYQLRSGNKQGTREGLIFFPDSGKILQTGAMYNGTTLDNPMILPYIDNASRRVYFADRGGNIVAFDLWQKNTRPKRINVGFEPTVMRTGWLDRKLIVGGDMSVAVYRADNLELEQQFDLPEEVNDIWVTGDSKTALFTMEYHAVLMRYDLQHNVRLPDIKLHGIAEANLIRMGSSNTLCY